MGSNEAAFLILVCPSLSPSLSFFTQQLLSLFKQPMALFLKAKHHTHQHFETKDGEPLQQLPAHVCPDTGEMSVLWQDVHNAFHGVDYVEIAKFKNSDRVLFMVDRHGT
jgi:hypothetical protein